MLFLFTTLLQSGCDDGWAANPAKTYLAADAPREALRQRLYAHSRAELRIWPKLSDAPAHIQIAAGRAAALLAAVRPQHIGATSVSYPLTDLPQVSLHLRRDGNHKLLVYNHGHGGLPTQGDEFAINFLREALANGHDLLVTSMPLTGLNEPDAGTTYKIRTRGYGEPVPVAPELLTAFSSMHALYEVIDDLDHYMHFFIDGALLPTSALAASLYASERTPYAPTRPAFTAVAYEQVDYVGLSGGATTGLTACAAHRFDHCILVAGVMPDHLRVKYAANFGDTEQQTRSFHEQFPMQMLLEMAQQSVRKLVLIYNAGDTCCFAAPSANEFRQQYPELDIRITQLGLHGYDATTLLTLLSE